MPAIHGTYDLVSDVLAPLRMRGETICVNEYRAPWAFRFARPLAHFHVVERGGAWLIFGKGDKPLRLEAGDLALLPLPIPHVLSSEPNGTGPDIETAARMPGVRQGEAYRFGKEGGEETHVVCGQFTFDGALAAKAFAGLPPVIHVRGQGGRARDWLSIVSRILAEETRHPRPGSAIMIERLLDVVFVEAVRDWSADHPAASGWLAGLIDAQVGRALAAMHGDPSRDWTVEGLAEVAGMSRAAFAARFLKRVGAPPMKYLASCRLDMGADHLRTAGESIGAIAAKVGYGSEAALTRAFKARFGVPPAAFRRLSRPEPAFRRLEPLQPRMPSLDPEDL